MVGRKSTVKNGKKRQHLTLRKRGGSRTEIASLFPPGGYDNFDWNFYLISAHGSLSQNMFEIPANTYILNLSPTGESCGGFHNDIDKFFYAKGDTDEDLKKQKKAIYEQVIKGFLTTRSSEAIEGRQHIYTDKNIRRNLEELYNSTNAEGSNTIAYYEPGDYMFDTEIYMRNHSYPILLMGVYKLPIKRSLKQAQITVNQPVWTSGKRPDINLLSDTDFRGALNVNDETLKPMLDEADKIYNVEENLAKDLMFPGGQILKLPGDYNTLVYKGKNPENINLKFYSENQIKELEDYLFPDYETSATFNKEYPGRLARIHPPDVNSSLTTRYNEHPFIRPGRKLPTLFDFINQLNHDDPSPKLIITQLCRSIFGGLKKADFTKQTTRRLSLAARERLYPKLPTATDPGDPTRLRSRIQHSYIQKLKDAIDRRLKVSTNQDLNTILTTTSAKLDTLLKKKIFNFRELRDILRTIYREQLVGLQQPLIDLLQLNLALPTDRDYYAPFNRPTQYGNRADLFFKQKKENYRKSLVAKELLEQLKLMQELQEKEARKQVKQQIKKLTNPTDKQKEAIMDFMIQLLNSPFRYGAKNPTEMENIYWSWVNAYLLDPNKPVLPKTDLNLKDLLQKFNHKTLLNAGIDITPSGIIII